MSKARKALKWEKQIELSIDPATAAEIRNLRSVREKTDTCTMCGEFCAMKVVSESKKRKK